MTQQIREIGLARTMGFSSITLLGIGALLGGGIFTLLGPAAGMAGPALFLSMILGALVAFLNLQMYIALGTTFPEAGGGYLWVRKGLGNFQGFLAGWFSWFAHSAAAGLYALSFGFYFYAFLKFLGFPVNVDILTAEKIFGALIILLFGYLNWRGSKIGSRVGNIITLGLLAILAIFIFFGGLKMSSLEKPLANFTPFLPMGILGILAATSFFYIAFEGSEIQVQTGEEVREPQKILKKGLFGSWAIVSLIYVLISIVIIGVGENGEVFKALARYGEGAIVKAAEGFMPFGRILMIIGGIFANLAALNATIFSSSRVSFALARDRNIWSHLANIHLKNLTPHLAIIFSTLLIIAMVLVLPLFAVGAVASLLFVLLFLQLNIAGINIHFKWPDTKWAYKIPFFPIIPLIAILIYSALALTMLKVSLAAWMIAVVWLILGFANYFGYAESKSREQFENKIVYEEAVRIGPKIGKRILLPLSLELNHDEIKNLTELAFALGSKFGGEVIVTRIHEIPPTLPLDSSVLSGAVLDHERQIFEGLEKFADEFNQKSAGRKKDINFHGLVLIGRDVVEVILDIVKIEDCDLLILNWEGYTQTKGAILSAKIDKILRQSKCDLLVVKDFKPIKSLMLATHPSGGSPYLKLMSEIVSGIKDYYNPALEFFSVLDWRTPPYLKPDTAAIFKKMELKKKDFSIVNFAQSRSIITAIIDEAKAENIELIVVGASRPKLLKEIRFGNIAEMLAKHSPTSLMIVKGYEGITTFWRRLFQSIR